MLALLPTTLLGASFASADTGYVGPLAAFSVLDESASIGLAARLGRGTKHSGNPLWRQTEPWETRIDNGYAEVFHDASDPLGAYYTRAVNATLYCEIGSKTGAGVHDGAGAWRIFYTSFIECDSDARDANGRWIDCGSGARTFAMLTANSSDGIVWEKPALDNDFCYVPGQHCERCPHPMMALSVSWD